MLPETSEVAGAHGRRYEGCGLCRRSTSPVTPLSAGLRARPPSVSAFPLSETAAKRRVGDILLAHGFVTAEELADAVLEQERTQQPLGQILVGRGSITRLELASALAEQWSDPAASISSTSRSSPIPVPAPSAQDEAQYAERLQEAVADLARKVQSNKPLEGIDERVDELSRRIEGTHARTQHIEAAVATLAEGLEGVTTGVEEAFYALQTGTADLVTDLARIEHTVGEIATGEVRHGDGLPLADLDELQSTVRDLESRSSLFVGLAERLDRVESETAGDEFRADLEGQARLLDELRTVVSELRERPAGTPDVGERLDRVEARLEGSLSEMEEVKVAVARHDDAAVDRRLDDFAQSLGAMRGEIADVVASMRPDEGSAERIEAVAARVEVLARQYDENHGLVAKVDALEGRLADGVVTADSLTRSIELAMSERDAPVVDERVTGLTAEVAVLRAEIASLPRQDERGAETDRLAEIEMRIENLAHDRPDDGPVVARLDELEKARISDLDTVNVLAVAMDRIRHDLTTAPPSAGDESSVVLEVVAALTQRIAALEDTPVATPPPALDESELLSELERFRLVVERFGLHLGEHDRAISDLAPSRGIQERLQELTVLVQDLAESQQNALAQQPAGAAYPISGDIDSLVQRVQEAETAAQSDSEKLMNRLERMASSIDWRLQRLEADETADAE